MAGIKRKTLSKDLSQTSHRRKQQRLDDTLQKQVYDNQEVELLEQDILNSRHNYNNISQLLVLAKSQNEVATISLCRVFCRLIAAGDMKRRKSTSETELIIIDWLKARFRTYSEILLEDLDTRNLNLLMRLVKEEVAAAEQAWKHGLFFEIVDAILLNVGNMNIRDVFVQEWIQKYDDVRFYFLKRMSEIVSEKEKHQPSSPATEPLLDMLLSIGDPPESPKSIKSFYANAPPGDVKHLLLSVSAHKKYAQKTWLYVLRSGLSKQQRKQILGLMSRQIVHWFNKPEILMDFLTDAYNVGGSTSLLALSGLFYLINEKNLDYPSFYQKLYSLLDNAMIHSKHRPKFLRLLETFMSSSHLPAALVASFIKRLARLALHAPPGAVVAVIPWMYNMFKKHPLCTFMMHREIRDPSQRKDVEQNGIDDAFDMDEMDPLETGAIGSCLWEIETLQSHYHPNVASIAKIISTQFTKESYNIEDFLDHSYNGLIEAELARGLNKAPVVEYELPKRIFTNDESRLNRVGGLLAETMKFEQEVQV